MPLSVRKKVVKLSIVILLMKVELQNAIKFNDLKPLTSLQWIFGDVKLVAD
jgi:hypothetical protein